MTYDYTDPGAYFVTTCTHRRKKILRDRVAALVEAELTALEARCDVVVDFHVIMDDHIHVILFLKGNGKSLSQVVGEFKSRSAVELGRLGLVAGKVWQRSFYDRVVRDENELLMIRKYIQENPLAEVINKLYADRRAAIRAVATGCALTHTRGADG